jgi:hypothetical protein
MSTLYYAIRARQSGRYLTASADAAKYLLLFREDFDARSYLNTHADDLQDQFTVELLMNTAIAQVTKRWELQGVGVVQDPLLPTIQFLSHT